MLVLHVEEESGVICAVCHAFKSTGRQGCRGGLAGLASGDEHSNWMHPGFQSYRGSLTAEMIEYRGSHLMSVGCGSNHAISGALRFGMDLFDGDLICHQGDGQQLSRHQVMDLFSRRGR
jgi:hypothetical protein